MRVFLDFEASSLAKKSYPIEVGWIFEDGRSEEWLIRPAADWTDWDEDAARIHGIDRDHLERAGTPHDEVATHMLEALAGHDVFASAPSWDGKWLSVLLRAAGLPRHAMRLSDTEMAQRETAAERLRTVVQGDALEREIEKIMNEARRLVEDEAVRHRALDDAKRELRIWQEVARLAGRRAGSG